MIATLNWLCQHVAIVRLYNDGDSLTGPWVWCVVVIRHGDTAELQGAKTAPRGDARRAGERALREAGFKRYWFKRDDGRTFQHEL